MVKCAIWGTRSTDLQRTRDGAAFDSPRAGGKYFITGTALASLRDLTDRQRALLTTYLESQRRLGVEVPEIDSTIVEGISTSKSTPVHERADRLLGYFARETEHLGERVPYDLAERSGQEMCAASESVNQSEVDFLLSYLHDMKYCVVSQVMGGAGDVELSIHGYERLAELDQIGAKSEQGFVAMWFDGSMDDAFFQGIAKGIEDAGYAAMRIDRKDHNNKIDDEIIAEIRRSRFLVADFTQGASGARGGVYYEAGYAHAMPIPVIFCCREDKIADAHFDTRQYSHILWTTPADLRVKLANRISATIGDGPRKRR